MKKIFAFVISYVLIGFANAQLPFINYQGVARNTSGQPLANQLIHVKSTIISNYPAANTTHYIEVRPVTTNQFGLFSFQLGNPTGATVTPLGGVGVIPGLEYFFIPWKDVTNTRLSTSISTNGGSSYADLGNTPLVSVPFANVAEYAKAAKPWRLNTLTNTIVPEEIFDWKLGLGTSNATEKLHVQGKIRMEDGQQGLNKIMTSDANGVAGWKTPFWTGIENGPLSYTAATNNRRVGIGLPVPDATLHVKGSFIFENLGNEGDGKVLTSSSTGLATWQSLGDNPGQHWLKSVNPTFGNQLSLNPASGIQYTSINSLRTYIQPSSPITGNWMDPDDYPLLINHPGGKTGLAIRMSGGIPKESKFITFFGGNSVKGRIEGQSEADLQISQEYILFNFFRLTVFAEYVAEAIASGLQLDFFELGVNTAASTALGIEWGILSLDWLANAGIAYVSGSADYAEWLEKADPAEKFTASDIVEVTGGKISKTITGKGQLMVISMAPIVLGNMPEPGKEKFSEKVAFMGQVPVKVTGDVAIGDYIISSGNNDGIGYAVHPADISTEEYKSMVGVAWSKSSGKMISLINTAVGLQTNAVVDMVKKQEEKLAMQTAQINQLGNYLAAKDATFKFEPLTTMPVLALHQEKVKSVTKATTTPGTDRQKATFEKYKASLTPAKVKKMLEEHPEEFTKTWKAFQETILEMSKSKSFNLDKNPEMKRLVYSRDAYVDNIKKAFGLL